MLDDVVDESQKTIDEVIPRSGLVVQATPDQLTVAGNQSHRTVLRRMLRALAALDPRILQGPNERR
jgi:hypothetical protein